MSPQRHPARADVVLPCLDEAAALPWVLGRLPTGYRAVVADNGSTDGSPQIAAELGATVVRVAQRGFGAAAHAGLSPGLAGDRAALGGSSAAPTSSGGRRDVVRRARGLARRHVGLLLLLVVASGVRIVVTLAYATALWFPDSGPYVASAVAKQPAIDRPWGYSGFLSVLDHFLTFRYVAVSQHGLGLVSVVLVYTLLQRRGVSRWVSLLAVVPLALDAYVLDIEHFLLAETLFMFLLVAAVVLLLWAEHPGPLVLGTVGVLMGALTLTRTIGAALAAPLLVYLLARLVLRTVRWTAVVAFVVGLAALLLPYAAWFDSYHGSYALTNYTGHFLYGRVADFVQCEKLEVPPRLQPLCPSGPPELRPTGDHYVWAGDSPANAAPGGARRWSDDDLRQFALIAIKGQPVQYLQRVVSETWHYATPGRHSGPQDTCPMWWDFPVPGTEAPNTCISVLAPGPYVYRPPLVAGLRAYQQVAYTPGPVLGLCIVAGLSALFLRGRSLRERLDPALLAVLGLAFLVVPAATASFDYRYLLPTLVVLPPAAALAARGLSRRRVSIGRWGLSFDAVGPPASRCNRDRRPGSSLGRSGCLLPAARTRTRLALPAVAGPSVVGMSSLARRARPVWRAIRRA